MSPMHFWISEINLTSSRHGETLSLRNMRSCVPLTTLNKHTSQKISEDLDAGSVPEHWREVCWKRSEGHTASIFRIEQHPCKKPSQFASCFHAVSYMAYCSVLETEAIYSSQTSADFQCTIWRYTPQIQILRKLETWGGLKQSNENKIYSVILWCFAYWLVSKFLNCAGSVTDPCIC
jgi:hypothetical protein